MMTMSTVFTNNRTQAVRLPADSRLPAGVTRVDVRVRGHERVIVPAGHEWDSFFLDAERVCDDFLVERASQAESPREAF